MALAARPDINLLRRRIAEPARYYHRERAIVIRKGLLICEERRHLWHELVHSDRQDEACHSTDKVERQVERRAALWAMPTESLAWAMPLADDWSELADVLKLPEEWVRFRWTLAPKAERNLLRLVNAHRS